MEQKILQDAKKMFDKSIEHLQFELGGLQVGRASASLVENIEVEAYGGLQALKAVAQITIMDGRTISIKPFDKTLLKAIEVGLSASNLGLNPNNNGESILLNIPPMTEERRVEVVKVVHKYAEEARISIRQSRQKFHSAIKALDVSEDLIIGLEKKLQDLVVVANKEVDEIGKRKENEILTV